jgi:hypothetical protein
MESVAGGGTAVAWSRAPLAFPAQMDVCYSRNEVITLKSRTVWFPVLHGRGFL